MENVSEYLGGAEMKAYVDDFIAKVTEHVEASMSVAKTSFIVEVPNVVIVSTLRQESAMNIFKGLVVKALASSSLQIMFTRKNGQERARVQILSEEEAAAIKEIEELGRTHTVR